LLNLNLPMPILSLWITQVEFPSFCGSKPRCSPICRHVESRGKEESYRMDLHASNNIGWELRTQSSGICESGLALYAVVQW
jgi:hypothetical protein